MHTAARAGRSPQIILLNTYRRCSHIGATACLEMQPLSNPASKVNTDHLGDCPNRCMKNITALLSQACRFRRYTLMWQASKQATRLQVQVSYHLVKFIPPRLMGLDLPRRGVIFASISGSSAPFYAGICSFYRRTESLPNCFVRAGNQYLSIAAIST